MRKVLSFVLVLSLVLGSFSMAFAATPAGLSDIDGTANEEAIQVNFDLGIVTGNPDGTFLPEKTVTRAEFAAMITRALAIPDSALAGYTTTSFKDTTGYGWAVPYLAFCQSKGIMLGDGNGNAMPGRTINTNEAVTMALRAIGYTANSAELVGAWPSNYVSLAQNTGLYDDVANVVNVDKANAAQVIYNLLTVQKVAVNSDGETKALWNGPSTDEIPATLLNTGLGATALTAAVITGEEDAAINLKPYVGAYAIAYEKDDEIIAMGDVKSKFLTGDYDSSDDGGILDVDGTEYKMPATKIVGVDASGTANDVDGYTFDNGVATNVGNTTAVAVFVTDASVKVAVDVTGKTINKIYSVALWTVDEAAVVDKADIDEMADNELLGSDFVLTDDDEIDYNSFELIGVKSLSDIKVDNVVYVYEYAAGHDDAGDIARVAVGTTIVEGKITDFNKGKWTIDGKKYEEASIAVSDLDDGNIVGDTFKLFLDYNGNIYDAEQVDGTPDTYGVIKDFDNTIDGNRIKLHISTDSTKTFTIDDDETGYATATGTIVAYGLDKDGVIDAIENGLTLTTSAGLIKLNARSIDGTSGGAMVSYPVASDAVAFVAADTADLAAGEVDRITTFEKLEKETLLATSGAVQVYVKDGKVVALFGVFNGGSADEVYGVFSVNGTTVNPDSDDKVSKLEGFIDGASVTKIGTKKFAASAIDVDDIGLYKVDLDADGYVTKIAVQSVDETGTIDKLSNSKKSIKFTGDDKYYDLADKVTVYEVTLDGGNVDKYASKSETSLKVGQTVYLYDTDDDEDGFDIVIFVK